LPTPFQNISSYSLPSVPFEAGFLAGVFDQDPSHRLGGGREEVPPAIPVLFLLLADQPQVRLVDQGRGLERLPRRFPAKPLCRQFAQLLVDQRQELAGRLLVAFRDGVQDLSDLAHEG
jgi:hypothetical protein